MTRVGAQAPHGLIMTVIVRHEKIEAPVTVIINPCGACAPTRVIYPRVHGDVRESTVTVVVVEDVVSEVCDVQILEAVVIVVPDSDSHSVAHMPDSGFLSDVHELELSGLAQQVTEEPVAGLPVQRRRKLRLTGILSRVEHRALHHIDVQVPVIVVIEEGDACSHNFGHVVLARGTREMAELQPNFFGHFAEQRNGWGKMDSRTPKGAYASGKPQGKESQEIAPSVTIAAFSSSGAFGKAPLLAHRGVPGASRV